MEAHWSEIALWRLDENEGCVLVSIVGVAGSTPRGTGAKMIVSSAQTYGTIGGGALEHQAIAQARAMMQRPQVRGVAQDYPLGGMLGQCCGGRVRLALESIDDGDRPWLTAAAQFEARAVPYILRLSLDGFIRECRQISPAGAEPIGVALYSAGGAMPSDKLRAPWTWREERVQPLRRDILLIGGGHVGAAVASVLQVLPVRLDWIDSRPGQEGPHFCGDPVAAVAAASAGTTFLVMTHDHALDFALCAAALGRGDTFYCGVIGSKTKRARFLSRLERAGIARPIAETLVCPIGRIGLTGKDPGIIAVAVAAELMLAFEAAESRTRAEILASPA